MIQGTTSDAGKTTLVAGLARVLVRRGVRVVPFKPQNMALNSAVTIDGGEIGRAQALQARAARLPAIIDMNPVLIKPSSDIGAQVIIHGKPRVTLDARAYQSIKPMAMRAVLESYTRLDAGYEVILAEGAGSPAEVNLRENDVANMGFAEAVDCPVVIVADIDRGGVFAHLVGTLACLSASERARVKGFVINRFRGDISLLEPGLVWLERETNIPVLGVLPYLHGLTLEAEDALPRERTAVRENTLRVVVPVLPRISNHTDFDPLRAHPDVSFRYVGPGEVMPPADLVILPGSKAVRADLLHLRAQGFDRYLARHLRYGGKVIGLCGGLQMLGRVVHDPAGLEGDPGSTPGFGLLDFETTLEPEKQLRRVSGTLTLGGCDAPVRGYEIHHGVSTGPAFARPLLGLEAGPEGAVSEDGQVLGTYVHGLFDTPEALSALLHDAGVDAPKTVDYETLLEASLDRLADAIEASLDMGRISALVGLG